MKNSERLPDGCNEPALLDNETHDLRAWAEAVTKKQPQDAGSQSAFLQSKIELIKTDATLSEQEKNIAITRLRERLKKIPPP